MSPLGISTLFCGLSLGLRVVDYASQVAPRSPAPASLCWAPCTALFHRCWRQSAESWACEATLDCLRHLLALSSFLSFKNMELVNRLTSIQKKETYVGRPALRNQWKVALSMGCHALAPPPGEGGIKCAAEAAPAEHSSTFLQ